MISFVLKSVNYTFRAVFKDYTIDVGALTDMHNLSQFCEVLIIAEINLIEHNELCVSNLFNAYHLKIRIAVIVLLRFHCILHSTLCCA